LEQRNTSIQSKQTNFCLLIKFLQQSTFFQVLSAVLDIYSQSWSTNTTWEIPEVHNSCLKLHTILSSVVNTCIIPTHRTQCEIILLCSASLLYMLPSIVSQLPARLLIDSCLVAVLVFRSPLFYLIMA
jgi:hypothetical protein